MAGVDRSGVESVLSRLDDLSGRLATAKSLSDVQESVGRLATQKALVEIQESQTKLAAEVKGLRDSLTTRITELEEAMVKGMKKLREEVLEAVEQVETDGGDSEETLAFMKEQVGEFKTLAKALIGDDVTLEVMRGKFRSWIGGGKKKNALAGGDDE